MTRFILLSFVFLGVGFYELSGGGDFDPDLEGAKVRAARVQQETRRLAGLPEAQRIVAEARAQASGEAQPDPAAAEAPAGLTLNLATYGAASGSERRTDPPAPVAEAPAPPAAEVAPPSELSVSALDRPAAPEIGIATFPGQTLTASSQEIAAEAASRGSDIRTVKGSLVNMRSGPGTDYDVVAQLPQATRVEVLSDTGNGWVELRPLDGGPTGWIAAFLLTDG